MDQSEEDAAADAARQVIRSKKLFRYYGASPNPLQRSQVAELERAFMRHLGAPHVLAVNSGGSALVCAIAALGIGPGDEVIVPAYTWVSTASAVLVCGAVPIVAEVDASLTLDSDDVRRRISPYTRAVIAVHMRGAPAQLDALSAICREHSLHLIEDVAQAAGGSFRGRRLGCIGDAGAFSFQMSKTLTAGEGGLVVSAAAATHLRAAMYHDSAACPHLGVTMDEWLPGVNLRMSELHAAVLLVQFSRLESILADMRARKAGITQMIQAPLHKRGVQMRPIHDESGDTATAIVFFLPDKERVPAIAAALADEHVPASRLYHNLQKLPHDHVDLHVYTGWAPILRQRSWSRSGEPWRSHPRQVSYSSEMCPATIDLLQRAVHVDVSPDLTSAQAEQIGAAIVAVIERKL